MFRVVLDQWTSSEYTGGSFDVTISANCAESFSDLLWSYNGSQTTSIELLEYVVAEDSPVIVQFTDMLNGVEGSVCEPTITLSLDANNDGNYIAFEDSEAPEYVKIINVNEL